MKLVPGSERMFADERTDPLEGEVRWAPAKSLWIGSMTAAALVLGPLYFSWDAFLLFVVTSGVTLCFGHSVGMHRRSDLQASSVRSGLSASASISAPWLAWPVPSA